MNNKPPTKRNYTKEETPPSTDQTSKIVENLETDFDSIILKLKNSFV